MAHCRPGDRRQCLARRGREAAAVTGHEGAVERVTLVSAFVAMVRRDPEQAREVVDEMGDISKLPWGLQSCPRKDMKLLQETVGDILDPIRKALADPKYVGAEKAN